MTDNTITLNLEGMVAVRDLSELLINFTKLTDSLAKEVADSIEVEWVIKGLEYGSACVMAALQTPDAEKTDTLMHEIDTIAESMESGEQPPYPWRVMQHVADLTSILDKDNITGFAITTTDGVKRRCKTKYSKEVVKVANTSFGSLIGRVDTVSSRRGFRIILYDDLFDSPVGCQLSDEQSELMRKAWKQRVRVTGTIQREALTGRPTRVTDVTDIVILKATDVSGFMRARGCLHLPPDTEPPEDFIRRIRDNA